MRRRALLIRLKIHCKEGTNIDTMRILMLEFHIYLIQYYIYPVQKMPGVVKVITAKDIPGVNNFSMLPFSPEEVSVLWWNISPFYTIYTK